MKIHSVGREKPGWILTFGVLKPTHSTNIYLVEEAGNIVSP